MDRLRPPVATILTALILVAAAIESAGIGVPITGARDTQCASIARNLGKDGWKGLFLPRADFSADGRGTALMEFPLVSALGASIREIAPAVGEGAYRIPSMAFGALAIASLFVIVRRVAGEPAALLAASLLAFSPLQFEMSASPRPDEAALGLTLAAFAMRDQQRPIAAACLALALLAKTTFAFVLVPWVLLDASGGGHLSVARLRRIAEYLAVVLPVALWHAHAAHVNAESFLMGDLTVAEAAADYAWQKGRVGFFVRFAWYARIGERLLAAATAAGTILALAGILVLRRRREAIRIVVAFGAGVLTLLAAFPWHAYDHHYYILFALPLTTLLGGLALDSVRRVFHGWTGLALVVAAVFLVPASGVSTAIRAMRSVDRSTVQFGEAARSVLPEDALLIVSAPFIGTWDASLLYRAERRGWRYSTQTLDESDPRAMTRLARAREERRAILPGRRRVPYPVSRAHSLTPEVIEFLRKKGAAFFAYAGPLEQLQAEKPDVAEHLAARYPLVHCNAVASFFDLR